MKVQSTGNNKKVLPRVQSKGFATLEILIAFAVVILSMSAVMLVVFSNQSLTIDTQTNNEAIVKTQKALEDARSKSRQDFNSIISDEVSILDGIYNKKNTVFDITQCKKQITSSTDWNTGTRTLNVTFSTLLSDIAGVFALGLDCQTDPPTYTWEHPQTFTTADIEPSGNKGTGIDVIKINNHKYGFLTSVHNAPDKYDFWVFDLEVTPPQIIAKLNTGPGLNAVDVAKASNGKYYAYLANNNESAPYEQLIVVDVTIPTAPVEKARRSLPGVSGVDPSGRTLYYYNEKLYIGTRLALGNEFHIYDVSNPEDPQPLGRREINHSIRKIVVRGTKAYLATTADSNELMVFDVSTPSSIQPPWGGLGSLEPGFNADGNEDGTSVYLLGNNIYLGRERTTGNRPELYILNVNDFSVVNSKNLNLSPANASVRAMEVIANFIFLGTSDVNAEFQVWLRSNLTTRLSHFNFPQTITGMEYMDDKIYLSVDSNDALHIIYDAP